MLSGFIGQRIYQVIGLDITLLQHEQFDQIDGKTRIVRLSQCRFRRLCHSLVQVAALIGLKRGGILAIGLA